jgi:hypothetical protein
MGLQTFPDDKAVPSQTGNSGKYLTTNGSTASWGTISAGSMTTLLTGSFSSTTTSIGTIPSGYKELVIIMRDAVFSSSTQMRMRFNSNSSSIYAISANNVSTTAIQNSGPGASSIDLTAGSTLEATRVNNLTVRIPEYADGRLKYGTIFGVMTRPGNSQIVFNGVFNFNTTSAITSAQFIMDSGNFTSGTYIVYGVN